MSWSYVSQYRDKLVEVIDRILNEERENLERASEEIARAIIREKMIYVLGTGHSMLIAIEMFHRAGGLARVYPILDPSLGVFGGALKSSDIEKLSGYADVLVKYYPLSEGDILMVISNSGKNAVPVEASVLARERGCRVIGITSVEYSRKLKPSNRYGKKLYEVADIVIDNKVPEGDAVIEVKELRGRRIAPISTIVNAFIAHVIEIMTVERLIEEGYEPEIWVSVNIPGGNEINKSLVEKYFTRIKHL
ncbi:MAG: SIS domain-containing protein [Sulfolobales archaeon]